MKSKSCRPQDVATHAKCAPTICLPLGGDLARLGSWPDHLRANGAANQQLKKAMNEGTQLVDTLYTAYNCCIFCLYWNILFSYKI